MGVEQLVDKSGEPSSRPVITRRATRARQVHPCLLFPKPLVRPIHTDTLSAPRHRPPTASTQTLCVSTKPLKCVATGGVRYGVTGSWVQGRRVFARSKRTRDRSQLFDQPGIEIRIPDQRPTHTIHRVDDQLQLDQSTFEAPIVIPKDREAGRLARAT
jgi:hypothetical protein